MSKWTAFLKKLQPFKFICELSAVSTPPQGGYRCLSNSKDPPPLKNQTSMGCNYIQLS